MQNGYKEKTEDSRLLDQIKMPKWYVFPIQKLRIQGKKGSYFKPIKQVN